MYDKLITFLNKIIPSTEEDRQHLIESFEPFHCHKNEVLVEHGKIARYIYFIASGYARVFHYEDGVEITNHLVAENDFVTAYASFTGRAESEEVVQTITDCELLGITKDKLDALYRKSHNWALFGIMMADHYLVFNNQRNSDLITLNAEEKYLKLMQEKPDLLQQVPLQYIASYIGIEPQTLSRIRRKIIS